MPIIFASCNKVYKRIVSVVPSQTELLSFLGLENEVIGITKFCIYPNEWSLTKIRVGGTKNLNIQKILNLQPDLIIANKEENDREQIEYLSSLYDVYVSDIRNLQSSLDMIADVGMMTDKNQDATLLISEILKNFNSINILPSTISVAYMVWKNPYMVAGGDTFISDMLRRCSFINAFGDINRYPEILITDLLEKRCECLLLSSEPYPFKESDIDALRSLIPGIKIILVDGEFFSWYGSRLLMAPSYFQQVINEILN